MASDIQSLTVQVPQLIQSVAVRAPQPVQSVVVSTGLRGITGEGEDSTARSAAAAAQLSADFGYSTAPSWGLKLRVHPGDASLFDVTAGAYESIDHHYTAPGSVVRTSVAKPDGILSITPLWGSGGRHPVYVSLDRDGSVIQSTQAPSLSDYSRYAYLGIVVVVPDTHTVALVFNLQNYGGDVGLRLQQFLQSVGVFNIDGNVYSQANASTTKIRRSAGHIFRPGCNSDIDPRIIDVSTTNATDPYESFHPVSHQGGLWYYPPANSSDIDGNNYDSGTDLLPMPSGYFQIQSIFTFGTASTFIQYGQVLYTTMAEAEAHVGDDFLIFPTLIHDFVLRCLLIVKQGYTDLNDPTQAKFFEVKTGKFGTGGGGSGGGSGGEVNTASNINSRGRGVFVQKSGVDLQFTGIDSADALLNVGFDSPTQTILLSTNISAGTGDPPSNVPNGSIYFKIV
jgi:hypothetical protein